MFLATLVMIHEECSGFNTFYGNDGTCHCLAGYSLGDPFSAEGCYKCDDQCHEKAFCVYPGRCRCLKGWDGDGVKICKIPHPRIVSIAPKKLFFNKSVYIRYDSMNFYVPSQFFCRFGNTIVEGSIIEAGYAVCKAPASTESALRLSISFTVDDFQQDDVFIQYTQFIKTVNGSNKEWIYTILLVSLIWFMYRYNMKKTVLII